MTAPQLNPVVRALPAGARGIDCITVLTAASAARLKVAGYSFAVRYLGALTPGERDVILGAGLALLAVGYARKPGWTPTAALGASDGLAAVQHAEAAWLPSGMTLFCDLEGPATGTTPEACIAYVNAWAAAVQAAGYVAGLYVGWLNGVPLTPSQLYGLAVTAYWHSCSAVPAVAVRGYQMTQDAKSNQWVVGVQVDVDVVQRDGHGDTPMALVHEAEAA